MQYYLSETNIFLFLIQVALLLGCARALGELFRKWGQPSITAEILVGVFFGPTILGRFSPAIHQIIFPADIIQKNMLETMAWIGILFFLLKSGLETNLATAWRQRGHAALLSFSDLIIPMVIAFIPCMFLPVSYVGENTNMVIFSFFIATIMTISALPVTARILQDLRVYRTDVGLLIMSALTINDVAGWVVFALILGFFTEAVVTFSGIAFIILATFIFAGTVLSLGPKLFDRIIVFLNKRNIPEPAGSLTLVCVVGLLCGAITTWIGIHALFGFFIAGIMAGESKHLSEHTRHIFSEMVHAILVPLFFAFIGLKLDFVGGFNLLLVLFILVIGIAGRYIGAYVGSIAIRQPSVHGKFIAWGHVPGGEMQIVIGMLALEYNVISEQVYIAIVFGAIVTAMLAGPLMSKVLKSLQRHDWLVYLPLENVIMDIQAEDRDGAIIEISKKAKKHIEGLSAEEIYEKVLTREHDMTSALDENVSIPHARLDVLSHPLVMFARSKRGIEWDASDGKPVHLIFFALTAKSDPKTQLQVLQGISHTMSDENARNQLLSIKDASEAITILRRASNAIKKANVKEKVDPGTSIRNFSPNS